MKPDIGFDCPYRDECLLAEERSSQAGAMVVFVFFIGIIVGAATVFIISLAGSGI